MSITFHCPHCGKTISVPDSAAGKKGVCKCGARIWVPKVSEIVYNLTPDAAITRTSCDSNFSCEKAMNGSVGGLNNDFKNGKTMLCRKCGKEISDDSSFCPRCGANVAVAAKEIGVFCHKCGKKIIGDSSFCPRCGANVAGASASYRDVFSYGLEPVGMFTALKKYAVFHGRARRKEFWLFMLFYGITSFVAGFADIVCFNISLWGPFRWINELALLLPLFGVSVRRMHDTDRSGWNVLFLGTLPWIASVCCMLCKGTVVVQSVFTLVQMVGGIVLLVYQCLDSGPDNKYGPRPK